MSTKLADLLKAQMLIFYGVAAISPWVSALEGWQSIFFYVVLVLAVVHFAEFLMMRKRLDGLPGGNFGHFLGTMLFGFVHWLPLIRAPEANA